MKAGIGKRFEKVGAAEGAGGGASWLTTFNDMITLLMVFFVLLFVLGSIDANKFKHFQSHLQSAVGVMYEGSRSPNGLISPTAESVTIPSEGSERPAERITDRQRKELHSFIQTEGLEARYTRRGIELTLDNALLFDSGSVRLSPAGQRLLSRFSRIAGTLKGRIRVEGHTDDRPIATAVYPSNWELSAARAVGVVKYLIQIGGIKPERLEAAGYGASKPRVQNDSEAHRASNRRVEIILGSSPDAGRSDPAQR